MEPIVRIADLPFSGTSHAFEGRLHGGVPASVLFFDGPPGSGPGLHVHPYAELFVVLEGRATFTVDGRTIEACAGDLLVAPPGAAHGFVNSGDGRLRQIDIHASDRFVTEWLED